MSATASVSLAQARALYRVLVECEAKLDALETKAKTTAISYADLYNVMQDVFLLLRKAGLPEEVSRAITLLQRLITTTYALTIAINALMVSTGGTAHLFIAGLGVVASVTSMASMVGSYG